MALEMLHQAHAADAAPPIEIDDDGWLHGSSVERTAETAKRSALAPGLEHVEGIAWHWTDTRGCGAMNLARRLLDPKGRSASWHVVIDATGAIVQSVSAKHAAWHVGSDSAAMFTRTASAPAYGTWDPLTASQRGKIRGFGGNSWLFGIELENVGELRRLGDSWLGWPFRHDYVAPGESSPTRPAVVPNAEAYPIDTVRGFHMFTDAQVAAAQRVAGSLVRRYGLVREACEWGHCQIDPERRTDPGPLWLGFGQNRGSGARTCARKEIPAVRGRIHDILDAIYLPT